MVALCWLDTNRFRRFALLGLVEIECAVDQADVTERLREISPVFAGLGIHLLGEQPKRAGVPHRALEEVTGFLDSARERETVTMFLQNPIQAVSQPQQVAQTLLDVGVQVLGALVFLGLVLAFSYFLLRNDNQLAAALRKLFDGRDTVAYAYASAVDGDLESVFFGNLLFVVAMSVVAAVAYEVTNLLAPQGLHIPMILVLAVLTGVTSLIPLVVSKVIYLPVVAYLGFQAVSSSSGGFLFVVGVLVVYFLVLDILPQTFLQPYITGRKLDMMVMMFAYILGPILFGWYGFFLMPIVFTVMLEAIRIPLPELVRGDPLTPDVSLGEGVGTDLQATLAKSEKPLDEDEDAATERD